MCDVEAAIGVCIAADEAPEKHGLEEEIHGPGTEAVPLVVDNDDRRSNRGDILSKTNHSRIDYTAAAAVADGESGKLQISPGRYADRPGGGYFG